MVIPIKCTLREYYKYLVQCLNPMLRLKPREKDVLSTLLMVYHSSKHLEEDRLYNLMYDKNTRRRMRDSIRMSEASFNNHISQLRKKKIINDKGHINKLLTDISLSQGVLDITYKIYVTGPGK